MGEKWKRAIADWLAPERKSLAQENESLKIEVQLAAKRVQMLADYILESTSAQ